MTRQLSELYRRGVVRPLDARAKTAVEDRFVTEPIRCEWLPILGDDSFAVLWNSGILQRIAEACGQGLADYEEIAIEPHELPRAISAVREDLRRLGKHPAGSFVESLLNLLVEANSSGMPVVFVL